MKVAIPIFRSRVSPVFDWCKRVLIVQIQSGREETRQEIVVGGLDLPERVERLSELGTEVLICGGISYFLLPLLESKGIRVIRWVAGEIEDVISALARDDLDNDRFLMPGCRSRQRRCGAGRGSGRGGGRGGGHTGGRGGGRGGRANFVS